MSGAKRRKKTEERPPSRRRFRLRQGSGGQVGAPGKDGTFRLPVFRPSVVLGVGIDLVENERMRQVLRARGRGFRAKVFLPREQSYCDSRAAPWNHYAGRFAVKEAVSKAFGTGVGEHIGWRDIEVVRDDRSGAPSVRLSAKGAKLAEKRGVRRILVSLAHTRHYAVAQALLVGLAP